MYVKEGLTYNKHTGELLGYCETGDINEHLQKLENEYTGSNKNVGKLASTMMVLMIRGLFTTFTFPYASFPSSSLTGEQLVPLIYEAILRIEQCGLKVSCLTMDGNSINRKLFKLIGNRKTNGITHKLRSPFSLNEEQEIFLFSDPPHLIKTARNCLASTNRIMEVSQYTTTVMNINVQYYNTVSHVDWG